ncbi:site-specific integrase [Weissella diestrammenae]|uniref:Site-specific integrase n=1 Tax=Weissella diestrammenae TaxID=1162633 RepID=A0A7G9T4M7_9LACO|nr:tyrosine-type recombinase/integrase [Weissella diestrammenae]MCM0582151.1 site-specific integrase [Weissella diestrammenae]QNN75052.1 site-specific integrase [Weissella diestrammenae]
MAIYKTSAGWRADYTYKDASGKYKKKSKTGFKTKRLADEWLTKVKNDSEKIKNPYHDWNFVDYFDMNMNLKIDSGIKPATKDAWRAVREYIVIKYFADIKISELTREKYQRFLNEYSIGHTANTVKKRHQIINSIIQQAFHDGIISIDPTYNVKITGTKDSKDASEKFLEADELIKLIEYFSQEKRLSDNSALSSFMIVLIAYSGLRAGEALALTRDDINLEKQTISINKTKGRDGINTTPKTKNSIREIKMPSNFFEIYNLFISHKHTWNKNYELFDGRRIASNPNKTLELYELKNNFKNIVSIHGLRHSHASYLLSKGINIAYISKRLGHANIAITQTIYIHLLNEQALKEEQRTINMLNNMI